MTPRSAAAIPIPCDCECHPRRGPSACCRNPSLRLSPAPSGLWLVPLFLALLAIAAVAAFTAGANEVPPTATLAPATHSPTPSTSAPAGAALPATGTVPAIGTEPPATGTVDVPSDCAVLELADGSGWQVVIVECPGWTISVDADGNVTAERVP